METRDDFFVHLNSKFNRKEYPTNTSNGFTNVIKPSLSLDTPYDVALENIIFDPDIFTIKKFDESYWIRIYVKYVTEDHRMGAFSVNYIPNSYIKVENIYQLVQYFNNDLVTFLLRQKVIQDHQKYILRMRQFNNFVEFNEITYESKYKEYEVTWTVSEKVGRVLGIVDLSFSTKPKVMDPPRFPTKLNCVHIYSDIIEATYLGDQTVHLLDILPMPHLHCKKGTSALFKRVNKTFLDSISIRITDEFGDVIPFTEDVSVVVILHFRRAI